MPNHPYREAWALGSYPDIPYAAEQYFAFVAQAATDITAKSHERTRFIVLTTSEGVRLYEADPANVDAEDGYHVIWDTDDRPFVLRAALANPASVALTDAAPVAIDWDDAENFTLTVTADRMIANPTNGRPGTRRTVLVQGNDGTNRTITFDDEYLGTVPTITDCDDAKWYLLTIFCVSATHFVVSSQVAKG